MDGTSTTEQIKSYLKRLGEGEDLESVRADFVKDFKEVDAAEIMNAEQELLKEGTPELPWREGVPQPEFSSHSPLT